MSGEIRSANRLENSVPSLLNIELHGGFISDLLIAKNLDEHKAERSNRAASGAPVFCTERYDGDSCTITYYVGGTHTATIEYKDENAVTLTLVETGEIFDENQNISLFRAVISVKSLGYPGKSA